MLQNLNLEQAARHAANNLIDLALAEDLGEAGDITSRAIAAGSLAHKMKIGSAVIIAKSPGVAAGLQVADRVFQRIYPPIDVDLLAQDSEQVRPAQKVAHLSGPMASILAGERVALNFLQRLSGIATLTRKFVDAVAGTAAEILDTRKTTPGWRLLEKYAVRCGGGHNHRLGLHDMFLIKENHIAAAGGIAAAVRQCREFCQQHGREYGLEVEAKTLGEVGECLRLGVQHIMLDNMPLAAMREAVKLAAGRAKLEASGNVSLENVAAIAATGVDYISIGALTHSAPAMDFSLLVE
jgi:nicotinate-nucleotide pyrophosphorylase (carboxylating)